MGGSDHENEHWQHAKCAPAPMPKYEELIAGLQGVAHETKGVVSAGLFGFGGDVDTLWIYDRNLHRGEFTRELNRNLADTFPDAVRHNMPWYGRKEGFHIDIMKLPRGSRFPQGPGRLVYNCFMQMGNWMPFYGKKDLTDVVWLPINSTNPKDRIKTFLKAEDGLYSMMTQLDARLGNAIDTSEVPVEWCDSSKAAKFLMADAVWALTGEYHTEAGAHGFNAFDVKKTREEFLTHFGICDSLSPSLVIRPKDDGQNKECLTGLLEIMERVAAELKEKLNERRD